MLVKEKQNIYLLCELLRGFGVHVSLPHLGVQLGLLIGISSNAPNKLGYMRYNIYILYNIYIYILYNIYIYYMCYIYVIHICMEVASYSCKIVSI